MKIGSPAVDKAELIKWWDTLDAIATVDASRLLQVLRECKHPDGQWLVSLFPSGAAWTHGILTDALLTQEHDPRALYLVWKLVQDGSDLTTLRRAAEMGYAPAQAELSAYVAEAEEESFAWAQKAAEQKDRWGLFRMGHCLREGRGCVKDVGRAVEYYKRAAELDCVGALFFYGDVAFGPRDWERFYWLARLAVRGFRRAAFCEEVLSVFPSFEEGKCGRVLLTVAPVLQEGLNVREKTFCASRLEEIEVVQLQRVMALCNAMLRRARRAIDGWSIVGRRLDVVKDVRVKIAKMMWEEAWNWGESG